MSNPSPRRCPTCEHPRRRHDGRWSASSGPCCPGEGLDVDVAFDGEQLRARPRHATSTISCASISRCRTDGLTGAGDCDVEATADTPSSFSSADPAGRHGRRSTTGSPIYFAARSRYQVRARVARGSREAPRKGEPRGGPTPLLPTNCAKGDDSGRLKETQRYVIATHREQEGLISGASSSTVMISGSAPTRRHCWAGNAGPRHGWWRHETGAAVSRPGTTDARGDGT